MENNIRKQKRENSNIYGVVAFVATLIVATVTIVLGVKDPAVWAFLGAAIGRTSIFVTSQL
ncbi:MAG: hypothetical protein MUO72_13450 [Bacteroidales bacterium]|nr:hypothetical protein [Bacteroidales bacterium]